jgi:hypothetical protein
VLTAVASLRAQDSNNRDDSACMSKCQHPMEPSALTQTEDTGIGASFSKIALAEVVHVKGRQSLLWALM